MGKIFIASCINCDYKTEELYLGGGMEDFKTYRGAPVINFKSKEIEVENGLEHERIEKENPNIGFLFLDDKYFKKHQDYSIDYGGEIGVEEFKDQELYLCPQCKEFKIRFLWQGMFD